jgi:hypothetical protein
VHRNTNALAARARGTGRAVSSDATDTRIIAPRPSRKARRRAALERATLGPFDARVSALLDHAIALDDWRGEVARFGDANGLSEQQRHELRVELLRRRIFHAAERGTERSS